MGGNSFESHQPSKRIQKVIGAPFSDDQRTFPEKKDVQIIRKKKQPIFAQKRIKEQAQEVVMFDVL